MKNIVAQLNVIIENYGNLDTIIFQQKMDEFLTQIQSTVTRFTLYQALFLLDESNLSKQNSDYLDDIVADLRGHTGKIFHRFADDPNIADDDLLVYVRSNAWNKGKL